MVLRRSPRPNWLLRCRAFAFAVSSHVRSRAQVEEQCNDPKLMQCGLEKCVASDGSVEWVAAHSKARLVPDAPQPHGSSP